MVLTTKAPCTILVTSGTARVQFNVLIEQFHADDVRPSEFKCLRCGLEWEADPLTDFRTVTCSNCYSERVILTIVRLSFENWGEQNGGEREQRDRYENAKRQVASALRAIGVIGTSLLGQRQEQK